MVMKKLVISIFVLGALFCLAPLHVIAAELPGGADMVASLSTSAPQVMAEPACNADIEAAAAKVHCAQRELYHAREELAATRKALLVEYGYDSQQDASTVSHRHIREALKPIEANVSQALRELESAMQNRTVVMSAVRSTDIASGQ